MHFKKNYYIILLLRIHFNNEKSIRSKVESQKTFFKLNDILLLYQLFKK